MPEAPATPVEAPAAAVPVVAPPPTFPETAAPPVAPKATDFGPRTIGLSELFRRTDVAGDRETALARLFGAWRKDYHGLLGESACTKARAGGLRCLSGQGGLQTISDLDRPAMLPLSGPKGARIHAVLIALRDSWAILEIGEESVRVAVDEIVAAWAGNYVILWQPPTVYRGAMRRGQKGADIAWLKQRLAELRGEAAEAAPVAVFDAALEAEVRAFQRSRPLLADGIAGARTLIHIKNAVGAPTVTLLAESGG